MGQDHRPSALYLLAHQGPMRKPRSVELQHMRIRRYIDLLAQFRHDHHSYNEDHDIYLDFNLSKSAQYPNLMRLGEAIGRHEYRAVFIDLEGFFEVSSTPYREGTYFKALAVLQRPGLQLINVDADSEGVIREELQQISPAYAAPMEEEMTNLGHDMCSFFPGTAEDIIDALFHWRFDDKRLCQSVRDHLPRRLDKHPYRAGREPVIPKTIWRPYTLLDFQEEQRERVHRRTSGERLYRVKPDGDGRLFDDDSMFGSKRSPESLQHAEDRLKAFGFKAVVDGNTVCFERDEGDFLLLGDPRPAGKIVVRVFGKQKLKDKRRQAVWVRVQELHIPDRWFLKKPADQFFDHLEKSLSRRNDSSHPA